MSTPSRPALLRRHHAAFLLVALGLYTFTIRVWEIDRHFWMYYDQMRDWLIAVGPLGDLPLVGTPSTAGGTSLGPAFYWALWLIAATVGPWFEDLPHAGGVGLSALQSMADVLLAYAIWRRLDSLALALAVVLFAASSPHDLAVSATIWNPVLSVALAKTALALLLLWGRDPSPWRMVAVAVPAWLAVQAHSGGLFVAAACFLWYVLRDLAARRYRDAAATAFTLQMVVLALQVPFLLHVLRQPAAQVAPTAILQQVGQAGDEGVLSVSRSFHAVGDALETLLMNPWPAAWLPWLLVACAAVAAARRWREPDLLMAAAAPGALAVVAFASWTRPFDSYWFLPIVPSAALLAGLAMTSLPSTRAARIVPFVALAVVVAAQPARVARSHEFLRLPEYDALVRGSRQIAKYGQPVARIEADFVDSQIDREVLFRLLGGELRADGPVATIAPDGTVTFARGR